MAAAAGAGAQEQPDSAVLLVPETAIARPDTMLIIHGEETAPDDIYGDTQLIIRTDADSTATDGGGGKFPVAEFVVPAATFTVASLFVRTPFLVHWREEAQKHLSNHGKNKTTVDNYLQYLPAAAPYLLYACGYKGDHNFLDKTILLAMSAATFAVLNNTLKFAFSEQRPDSQARNSFPSGHTGTAFIGAEYMRREYWNHNKWVAMSGYMVATAVAYLRIYNNRHWINDVVGGAALGYLSTTFAYWIYPKIFRKRERMHRQELLIRQQKKQQSGQMVMAAPFATGHCAGINLSYTFRPRHDPRQPHHRHCAHLQRPRASGARARHPARVRRTTCGRYGEHRRHLRHSPAEGCARSHLSPRRAPHRGACPAVRH